MPLMIFVAYKLQTQVGNRGSAVKLLNPVFSTTQWIYSLRTRPEYLGNHLY